MLKAKNNNKRDAQCFKESNAMLNAIRGASDAQHHNWKTQGVASVGKGEVVNIYYLWNSLVSIL